MKQKRFYRLNQYIFAKEVRVIDEKGKQIGLMSASQALQQARTLGLDLVEIVPNAKPPVCKIINFKKFLFLEAKKLAEEKRKSKKGKLKEVQLTPFIAQNDLRVRLERTEKFLKAGDKVKIVVRFRGREMDKKDFGYRLIGRVLEELKEIAETDLEPRFMGRQLETMLRPAKGEKNVKKT